MLRCCYHNDAPHLAVLHCSSPTTPSACPSCCCSWSAWPWLRSVSSLLHSSARCTHACILPWSPSNACLHQRFPPSITACHRSCPPPPPPPSCAGLGRGSLRLPALCGGLGCADRGGVWLPLFFRLQHSRGRGFLRHALGLAGQGRAGPCPCLRGYAAGRAACICHTLVVLLSSTCPEAQHLQPPSSASLPQSHRSGTFAANFLLSHAPPSQATAQASPGPTASRTASVRSFPRPSSWRNWRGRAPTGSQPA